MICCMKKAVVLPGLALALLVGPAALAAPEDEKPQAQQNQAAEDNKSYLPPWMQKPDAPAGATANAADKGAEAAALESPGDPAKQKPAGQRAPRRHHDSGFWPNFFWR